MLQFYIKVINHVYVAAQSVPKMPFPAMLAGNKPIMQHICGPTHATPSLHAIFLRPVQKRQNAALDSVWPVMSEFLIYQSEDGKTQLSVVLENETVWLSQKQLTELFGQAKGTVSEHIKLIFKAKATISSRGAFASAANAPG